MKTQQKHTSMCEIVVVCGNWALKCRKFFYICELVFRRATSRFTTTIDSHKLVLESLKNSTLVSNFNASCMSTETALDKEIRFNLLGEMIMLFIRVRTFSFTKDVRERHKVSKEESRKHSLRTEIKKSCSNTGGGDHWFGFGLSGTGIWITVKTAINASMFKFSMYNVVPHANAAWIEIWISAPNLIVIHLNFNCSYSHVSRAWI